MNRDTIRAEHLEGDDVGELVPVHETLSLRTTPDEGPKLAHGDGSRTRARAHAWHALTHTHMAGAAFVCAPTSCTNHKLKYDLEESRTIA